MTYHLSSEKLIISYLYTFFTHGLPGLQSSQAPLNICAQFISLKINKIKLGQQQSTDLLPLDASLSGFSFMTSKISFSTIHPPSLNYFQN
jgi:hypothetical protein